MSLYEIDSRIAEAKRRRAESQVGRDNAKFVLVVSRWVLLLEFLSCEIGGKSLHLIRSDRFLTWPWIRDSNWREETWEVLKRNNQETKRRWENVPDQFVAMFHVPSRMIRRMTASYCAWSGRGGLGLPSTLRRIAPVIRGGAENCESPVHIGCGLSAVNFVIRRGTRRSGSNWAVPALAARVGSSSSFRVWSATFLNKRQCDRLSVFQVPGSADAHERE